MTSFPLEEVTFTADDAVAVARHLQESPVVLVGGQSLNFWAELFQNAAPELAALAPFQSSDVDFLGTIPDVQACADRLGGTVAYPGPDHINTPEVGVVHCVINDKHLKIDFLGYLAGLKSEDVRKTAISTTFSGVVLRVMHPVYVVKSRIANITQLQRLDPLALRQMRVSLHVVAEYIRRAALSAPREALDMIEAVFEFAVSRGGLHLWHAFEIDIFNAIQVFEGLPTDFDNTRMPQMRDFLALKRARYKAIQDGIAEKKRYQRRR